MKDESKVTFTVPIGDKFEALWLAVCLGRVLLLNDKGGRQLTVERRYDTAIVRALKGASTEAHADVPKLQTNDAARVPTEGATFQLAKEEVGRLLEMIDRVGWETRRLEVVDDLVAWLKPKEAR